MYAVVNTFAALADETIGTIISRHRTVSSAARANRRLQTQTKRSNGQTSYLPTTIVRTDHRIGTHLRIADKNIKWSPLDNYEADERDYTATH